MENTERELKSKTLKEVMQNYSNEHLSYDRTHYCIVAYEYFENLPVTWYNLVKYIVSGLDNKLSRTYKSETLYTQYCLIRAAFSHATYSGFIKRDENIIEGQQLPPQVQRRFRMARRKEYKPVEVNHDIIEIFLNNYLPKRSHDTKLAIMAKLAYLTGMRLGEVCGLRWVSIKTDYIYLDFEDTKERHDKKIPLSMEALNLIRKIKKEKSKFVFPKKDDLEMPQATNVVSYLIKRHWKKYQKTEPKADFDFSFKSLRTAFIQAAQYNGTPIESIRKAVGHKNGFITDDSYSSSLCHRAIKGFNLNPVSETTEFLIKKMRNELTPDDVKCIDLELLWEKVKDFIFESRQVTDDGNVINFEIPLSKGGIKKDGENAEILQFGSIG